MVESDPGIILILTISALLGWFWFDTLRAREQAISVCRRACDAQGVQLLDQSVSLHTLRLRRSERGRVQFLRTYQFSYSLDGVERADGTVILLGLRSELIRFTPET